MALELRIVPDRLRLARKNKRLTQAALAKTCGVEPLTISRLERGLNLVVGTGLLDALRRELQVGGYWLLGITDVPTMPEYPTPAEKELLDLFRQFDGDGQVSVLAIVREAAHVMERLQKPKLKTGC